MSCYMMTESGYAYALNNCPGNPWRSSHDDFWDLEAYGPDGQEEYIGMRRIDGYEHCVFKCTDGIYRARLVIACRNHTVRS